MLITCALIYANGSLHIGHMLEYIQADIFKRFHVIRGQSCTFIGGNDMHGTPIMLLAKKMNMDPELMTKQFYEEHKKDLDKFHVEMDFFGHTHTPDNQAVAYQCFEELKKKNAIEVQWVDQAYDDQMKCFLSDRYIKGTCPSCDVENQYGDSCEVCGSTYNALDLKNPISALSKTPIIFKNTKQYSLKLTEFQQDIIDWLNCIPSPVTDPIKRKLFEWLDHPLKDVAVSRSNPYFGFLIPTEKDLYFYVWLDALLGYISILKVFSEAKQDWQDKNSQIYHFIGKDIVNFHAIIWPAILKGSGYRLPTVLAVHGHVTINKSKMSKSRNILIHAKKFAAHIPTECLRFYFASKTYHMHEDINFSSLDFKVVINDKLIDKVVNIMSRCATLIHRYYQGELSEHDPVHIAHCIDFAPKIHASYQSLCYAEVVKTVLKLSDYINSYLTAAAPWVGAKNKDKEAQKICTTGIHAFFILSCYLQPILPQISKKTATYVQMPVQWPDADMSWSYHSISAYEPLLSKITDEMIDKVLDNTANE